MYKYKNAIKFEIFAKKLLYRNYKKYYSQNFNILLINSIFFSNGTHFSTRYAENLNFFSNDEFLSCFYTLDESLNKIIDLTDYYTESIQIYPNYFPLNEAKYLFCNILKKQSLVNEQEKILEKKNKNKNKIHSNFNSNDNETFSRIFNSKIKKEIQNFNDSTLENLFGIKNNKHLILDLSSFKDEIGEVKPNVLYCIKKSNRDSEKSVKNIYSIINAITNNEKQTSKTIVISKNNSKNTLLSNGKAIRLKKKSLNNDFKVKGNTRNNNSRSNTNFNLDLKTITFYKYCRTNSSGLLNGKNSVKENKIFNTNKINSSNIINLTENNSIKKNNNFKNSKRALNVKKILISNLNNNHSNNNKIKIGTKNKNCYLSPKLKKNFKYSLGKSINISYKINLSKTKNSRSQSKKNKQIKTLLNNDRNRSITNLSNNKVMKKNYSRNNFANNTINSISKNNNTGITKIYLNFKFHKNTLLLRSPKSNQKLKEININLGDKIRNRLYNGNSYKRIKKNASSKSSKKTLITNNKTTHFADVK